MRHISTQSLRRFWLILVCGLIAATWLACLGEETVSNEPAPAQPSQPTRPVEQVEPEAQAEADLPTTAEPGEAPAAQPGNSPTGQEGQAEWTVMLYQDADDEILEQDIMFDFNEAELFGSSDQVNIVAQVDRYKGAFKGMGNWTGTKRFYISEDNNLKQIKSTELADMGELNMADSATLVDFITWAVGNYPARKYALIMSDHGAGWPGGWNDPDPGGTGPDRVAVAQLFGVDGLWLMELDRALAEARAKTGLDKFDLIGFDACLMGQLEVFTMLEPHARYAVASQEVEPALGWAYASFLAQLIKQPEMDGAGLAQLIVGSYIDQDLRIIDEESRQELLAQEFNFFGKASAEEVAEAKSKDVTLTAVDLSAVPAVNTAVDNLATVLVGVSPKIVAQARAYAQSFQSIFGEQTPSPYIDLGHFTQLLTELNGSEQVVGAANQVGAALKQATIAEKHGSDRPGASGFTIYFPISEIYNTADDVGYTTIARRFADISKWDDFLAAFYTGRPGQQFNQPDEAPAPQTNTVSINLTDAEVAQLQADILYLQRLGYSDSEIPQILVQEGGYPPEVIQALVDGGVFRSGASRSQSLALLSPKPIQLTPLTLSAELASPTEPVTITTELSGDRLAYLYTFIGRLLPREDALIIEDIDYIFADESQEVGGVQYPVWPEGSFPVEFTWEPTVYAASDGTTSIRALFEPVKYDPESPTYSLGVTYHPASGGEPRFAKIYFRDDRMTDIFGFTSGITQAFGAPRQILPQPGDQFTVLEKGDDLTQEGDAGREKYVREAGTLTFNGQPFTLETTPAPSGNYVIGFIAEDLDGHKYEQYEGLFVLNEAASSVDGFAPFVSQDLGFALLYPEKWTVAADTAQKSVDFSDEAGSAQVTISQAAFPDASSAGAANSQAIQQVIDSLNQDGTLENLQFLGDVQDYVLGAFDAQTLDFAFDLDGRQPYYGYAVASTPISGTTYVVLASSLDAEFDRMVPEFDDMLYSFDILISGISKEQAGPPSPAFASEAFADDFSNPASGLISDEAEQDWGRGYYSQAGQYIFELKPDPGAIYDYYPAQTLPADFLIQASASYTGTLDNAYGLIFRVQKSQEHDDFYTFRISGDGFYSVEKTEGDKLVPIIDWTASSLINQAAGAANLLMVEGQADTYKLYLNGQQVNSFSDATYSSGSFGFMVDNYDQTAPANFSFDDLRVGAVAE